MYYRPVFWNIDKPNIIRDYHCIIALCFEILTSLILSEIITTIVAITNTIYETTTWTMITWILYLEVVYVICQVVDLYRGMGEHSRGLEMVSFQFKGFFFISSPYVGTCSRCNKEWLGCHDDKADQCNCIRQMGWRVDQIFDCLSFIALTQFPFYRKIITKTWVICKACQRIFAKLKMMALSGNREGGIFNRLSIFQLDGVEPSNNLEIIFSTLIEKKRGIKRNKFEK